MALYDMKEIMEGQTPCGLSFLRSGNLTDPGARVMHKPEVALETV